MAIRMSETIYYVTDMDRAVAHYQALGWKLVEKMDWGWAVVEVDGGGRLGLLTEATWRQGGHDYEGLPRPRIAFQTDEIENEVIRLKEAGADVDPLKGNDGEMRAVTFRDVDGNEFFLWDDGKEMS